MAIARLTAAEVIAQLDLQPHPEGGYFKETFRDPATVREAGDSLETRAASTAIYFLLKDGEVSRWHRVDAAEVWHWYAGDPLTIAIKENRNGAVQTRLLGADLHNGQRPQAVVPAGFWQSAESLGAWTLVGCTVAPGFQFSGFELEDC